MNEKGEPINDDALLYPRGNGKSHLAYYLFMKMNGMTDEEIEKVWKEAEERLYGEAEQNEPTCADCVHRYRLENWHYHEAWNKGKYGMEVKHTEMNGFVCDIFANEGTMVWLTGECGEGGCEMYERRE